MKWVVISVRDEYIVARNGDYGIPDVVDHHYLERHDAEEVAERMNEAEEEND